MNQILAALNPLIGLQVKPDGSGKVDWSDGNVVITLRRIGESTGSSSGDSSTAFHAFKIYHSLAVGDADYWRTFKVRAGYCGVRPLFHSLSAGGFPFQINANYVDLPLVETNTDENTDESSTLLTGGTTITLSDTPDDDNAVAYGFWIEFTPDPDASTDWEIAVNYRRYAADPGDSVVGGPTSPFPGPSENIVPIGYIEPRAGMGLTLSDEEMQDLVVYQLLKQSPIDRISPKSMHWRGVWDADGVYYPYDVVTYESGGLFYPYITTAYHTPGPPGSAGDWQVFAAGI